MTLTQPTNQKRIPERLEELSEPQLQELYEQLRQNMVRIDARLSENRLSTDEIWRKNAILAKNHITDDMRKVKAELTQRNVKASSDSRYWLESIDKRLERTNTLLEQLIEALTEEVEE